MANEPSETNAALAFTVETVEGRLDQFLSRQTGRSRVFVQEQIDLGHVQINGVVATKASQAVRSGDRIKATWEDPAPKPLTAVEFELDILHEDADIVVVNKPQGVVTHPGAGHHGPTLVNYLMHHLRHHNAFSEFKDTDRPGIIHRLDRGTSGVICLAKNRTALEKISAQFKDREVTKTYEALAWGKMGPQGRYKNVIGRDRINRKKMSSKTDHGREALTEWKAERVFAHFTWVKLFPKTGRTHQLRVHLSEAHYPILGDATYGGKRQVKNLPLTEPVKQFLDGIGTTFLHAENLTLTHPTTGKRVSFRAPRPALFDDALKLFETHDT